MSFHTVRARTAVPSSSATVAVPNSFARFAGVSATLRALSLRGLRGWIMPLLVLVLVWVLFTMGMTYLSLSLDERTLTRMTSLNLPKEVTRGLEECIPAVSAATASRSCMRQPLCLAAALATGDGASGRGSTLGRPVTDSTCSLLPPAERHKVTLLWMTTAATFSIRNQWSLESLLRQHPCADVRIVAPLLPEDFFQTFADLGYSVRIVPLDLTTLAPYTPAAGEPGYRWVQSMEQHKKKEFFAVHVADILRMLILYKEGGTYMDFDHIVLRPMMHLQNAIGSEICRPSNPDCVTGMQLARFNVTRELTTTMDTSSLPASLLARSRFDENVDYTPCNGVLINWRPDHAVYRILLSLADQEYDPDCWGCLGPRLLGRVLQRGLMDEDLLAKLAGSFHLLQSGLLYPFDYGTVSAELKSFNDDTALFMCAFKSIGIHFFGKMSTNIKMRDGSTIQRVVAESTLFNGNLGRLDWDRPTSLEASIMPYQSSKIYEQWIVRKPLENFCGIGVKSKRSEEGKQASMNIFKSVPKLLSARAKVDFDTLPSKLHEFSRMARQKQMVLLCHKNWLGIREMTIKIGTALGLPILLIGDGDLKGESMHWRMGELLQSYHVRVLVVNGVPPGTLELAKRLHENKIVRVAIVYHSGVGFHNLAIQEAGLVGLMAVSALQGHIALAFLEHDQAASLRHLGIPACAIPSTFVVPQHTEELPPVLGSELLRIGVLGSSFLPSVKNFFTQMSAACMFPGAEIHLNTLPDQSAFKDWYLNFCTSRIVVHGKTESSTFTHLLGKMHLNLYVSNTEAVPNVVVNSLSAGVPVITSDTSPWFDGSPELKDLLVEPRIDDPHAIYRRAVRVLAFAQTKRPHFERLVKEMLAMSHKRAMASWNCFLRGLKMETGIMCPVEHALACEPLGREHYDPLVLLKADGLNSAGVTWLHS